MRSVPCTHDKKMGQAPPAPMEKKRRCRSCRFNYIQPPPQRRHLLAAAAASAADALAMAFSLALALLDFFTASGFGPLGPFFFRFMVFSLRLGPRAFFSTSRSCGRTASLACCRYSGARGQGKTLCVREGCAGRPAARRTDTLATTHRLCFGERGRRGAPKRQLAVGDCENWNRRPLLQLLHQLCVRRCHDVAVLILLAWVEARWV